MTGATPASPKHLAWRLQRRRSGPPRLRSDRASRRAQIDHKGTRVVAQGDESTRAIHRDVGKQYFVKISLSASLESVRKHQAGLQSFRSMRRIEASRRNA